MSRISIKNGVKLIAKIIGSVPLTFKSLKAIIKLAFCLTDGLRVHFDLLIEASHVHWDLFLHSLKCEKKHYVS